MDARREGPWQMALARAAPTQGRRRGLGWQDGSPAVPPHPLSRGSCLLPPPIISRAVSVCLHSNRSLAIGTALRIPFSSIHASPPSCVLRLPLAMNFEAANTALASSHSAMTKCEQRAGGGTHLEDMGHVREPLQDAQRRVGVLNQCVRHICQGTEHHGPGRSHC
jgi:hypothetical protein